MRATRATTVAGVYQTIVVLHLAYTAAIPIYFVVGEIMKAIVFPPEPALVNFGSPTIWVFRSVLVLYSVISLALANTIYGDSTTVARILKSKDEVNDGTVAAALQTACILRLANVGAVGIFGLVLFIFDGHRYDLYGFGIVALLNLIALRPTRDSWEEIYRRTAAEYPGVSSSPFGQQT